MRGALAALAFVVPHLIFMGVMLLAVLVILAEVMR
jgi:hypothetical protein